MRGLADFATYRFRVAAVNAEGAGPLSKPSNAVRPMAPVAARLIGRWLGPPVPAQAPSCGSGYSQWQFTASGQFSALMATSNCGGYDISGKFWIVSGNVLWEKITNTGTSYPPPPAAAIGKVAFVTVNAFRISDSINSYTFNRD